MIREGESTCPRCGGELHYYDKTPRVVLEGNRKKKVIEVCRYRCEECGSLHRELPDYVYPFRQYDLGVIEGVLEGFISPETYGYEDYPCELTMKRWCKNLTISDLNPHPPTLF